MSESDQSRLDEADHQMEQAIQASQGDDDAFQEFFGSHRQALYRFIDLRIDDKLRRRASTSDILQETALDAHRRLADYVRRRPMAPRVWLLKMAAERLRDARVKHFGRQRRAVDRDVPLPDRSSMALAQQLARHPSPSEEAMRTERRQSVAKMVNRLTASEREILLLRHVDSLGYDEISDLLEINVAAARKRYTRALMRLQGMCNDDMRSEMK